MDTIVKSFVGLFFSLVLLLLGIGIIAASVNTRNAGTFAADCVTRIENSDFSDSVITDCEEEAAERGYTLSVEVMAQEGRPEAKYGSLRLEYPFRIPVVDISRQNVMECSIR